MQKKVKQKKPTTGGAKPGGLPGASEAKGGELSSGAQIIYNQISESYGIDDPAGKLILTEACRAWDFMKQAEAEIELHGLVVVDRYQQVKANPAAAVLRDSRSQFLQALKLLQLDLTPGEITQLNKK